MISRAKSEALFAEALNCIPGGVNSPVRAFRAVGGKPFFVNKAAGCRMWGDGVNPLARAHFRCVAKICHPVASLRHDAEETL